MKIKLSTYQKGQMLPAHHFFILNKGMNAGKPGDNPWTNSFIADFETLEERDHIYWLCYGLWVTGKFHPYLIGTAIPFIRKNDLFTVLDLADVAIHYKKEMFIRSISVLYQSQISTERLTKNLSALQQARVEILRHFINI